jgi:isoquinoline 1-oxidoreductase beta subunit
MRLICPGTFNAEACVLKAAKISRGVAAYFCHNTYVAEVVDLKLNGNNPVIENMIAAVDCGIVVNPDAAKNLGEGGIIDCIGMRCLEITFKDGVPDKNNFHQDKMIRQKESQELQMSPQRM